MATNEERYATFNLGGLGAGARSGSQKICPKITSSMWICGSQMVIRDPKWGKGAILLGSRTSEVHNKFKHFLSFAGADQAYTLLVPNVFLRMTLDDLIH